MRALYAPGCKLIRLALFCAMLHLRLYGNSTECIFSWVQICVHSMREVGDRFSHVLLLLDLLKTLASTQCVHTRQTEYDIGHGVSELRMVVYMNPSAY